MSPVFTGSKFGFSSVISTSSSSNTDPNFSSRRLLLHMDGVNGSTSFPDSSSYNFVVTSSGATVSTSNFKYGTGSGLFNGSTTYIYFSSLITTSSAYTVEAWVYPTSFGQTRVIATGRGFTNGASLRITSSGLAEFLSPNFGSRFSSVALTLNSWQHVALTRTSSFNYNIWIDGQSSASWTGTDASELTAHVWKYIGMGRLEGGPLEVFAGNIDDLRISDRCEYTSNFTPPTAPFPNS